MILTIREGKIIIQIRETVEMTMQSHNMLRMRSVLVGLSGGADSAALVHILCALSEKYGFKVYTAHINHGLRGAAADRDEEYSRALAGKLGIEFFLLRADVCGEARRRGIGEEQAGRDIRYGFFERIMNERGIDCTATAHHKNDNAETIIMNFIRGTGLKGLCGIPYRRGRIIRPLLDCTRAETERYCEENGILYVTDATNLDNSYTRNRIRNVLIPQLQELFNPSVTDTITKNAAVLACEEDFIEAETDRAYDAGVKDGAADINYIMSLHRAVALRLIRRMIRDVCGTEDVKGCSASSVLELARRGRTGSRLDIARGAYAAVEYGKLRISAENEKCGGFSYRLIPGERIYIPEMGAYAEAEYADGFAGDGWEYFSPPSQDCVIRLRSRRAGDRFRPQGMTGTKSVKNFMIDEKIPRDMRDRTGIVDFDGDIAWIVGYRRDERFKFNKIGIKIRIMY